MHTVPLTVTGHTWVAFGKDELPGSEGGGSHTTRQLEELRLAQGK